MKSQQLYAEVARSFAGGSRGTRIGTEHELLTLAASGAPAAIETVRAAVRGSWYADAVGFEPGGQVELSLPVRGSAAEAGRLLEAAVDDLAADLAGAGVALLDEPVDLRAEVPQQLTGRRYTAMRRHFDALGPHGARMMCRTAGTQVCLDWWRGAAGVEQWRVLQLAGPFLAAAFARSTGPASRLSTWLALDPGRTAYDDRLLRGDDLVRAYVDFAAGATVFTTPGDAAEHLSTLFPPVRPRGGYLEVRFLDVQPATRVGAVAAVLARLLYDDEHRRQVLRQLEPSRSRLGELWQAAALGDPDLVSAAAELIDPIRFRRRAA
jgi:glutamate--cysteine ligase